MPEFSNLSGITSEDQNADEYMTKMQPDFPVIKIPGMELFKIVRGVPVLIILKDGVIEKRFRGDKIPCGPVLEKMLEEGE